MRTGSVEDTPIMADWMTATQIANLFGISRQTINRMVHSGQFETLMLFGERPVYIIRTDEVLLKVAARADSSKQHIPISVV